MADKTINELTAATTMGNDDLLVLQQGGIAKKLSGKQLGDYVYNAAVEKVAEVNQAVDDARSSINDIVESVQSMTELGTDTTLTITGMAADAKVAGDKIKAVETAAMADLSQGTASGSIVTITDGADNIPVKKMTVDIEPAQDLHGYDYPWPAGGGKNLLQNTHESSTVGGVTFTVHDDGTVTANGTASEEINFTIKSGLSLEAGSYVLSGCPAGGSSSTYRIFAVNVGSDTGSSFAFTLSETTATTVRINIKSGTTVSNLLFKPMICLASATDPTTFAPYSNICPITGWTGAKVTRTGKNLYDKVNHPFESYSGRTDACWTSPIFLKKGTYTFTCNDGFGRCYLNVYGTYNDAVNNVNRISQYSFTSDSSITKTYTSDVYIRYQQNSVTGSFADVSNVWQTEIGSTGAPYEPYQGDTYDITFPSEAGIVHGGSLEINEDGSGTLTVDMGITELDGSADETWNLYTTGLGGFYLSNLSSHAIETYGNGYCNRFPTAKTVYTFGVVYGINSRYLFFMGVRNFAGNTVEEWRNWLANNPVSIVYKKPTPLTYSLTAAQVTTLLGTNNILADAGDISEFIYRKAPVDPSYVDAKIAEADVAMRAAIESMIAGRETAMTATKNYSFGGLVIVNHTLYKLDANVASGETLTPGSNCHATTVEAEIAECIPNYRSVNGKMLFSDITLSAEDIPYDDSLSEHTSGSVGEAVNDLKDSLKYSFDEPANIVEKLTFTSGKALRASNGTINTSNVCSYTNYVAVKEGQAISINQDIGSGVFGHIFYNQDKSFLIGVLSNPDSHNIVVPSGAYYVRFTVLTSTKSTLIITIIDRFSNYLKNELPKLINNHANPFSTYIIKGTSTALDGFTHCAFPSAAIFAGKEVVAFRASMQHQTPTDPANWGGIMLFTRSPDGTWENLGLINTDGYGINGELRDPKLTVSRDGTVLFVSGFTCYRTTEAPDTDIYDTYILTLDTNFHVTGAYANENSNYLFWGNCLQTPEGHLLIASYYKHIVKIHRSTAPFTGDISNISFSEDAVEIDTNGEEPTIGYWDDKLVLIHRRGNYSSHVTFTENLEGNSGWEECQIPSGEGYVLHAPVLLPYWHGKYLPYAGARYYTDKDRKPFVGLLSFDETTNIFSYEIGENAANTSNFSGYCGMIYFGGCDIGIVYYLESSNKSAFGAQTGMYYKHINLRTLAPKMAYMQDPNVL